MQARRLISIPELLAMIVDGLDIEDQRKLMRVSNHFFYSIGPKLWKSVPRLEFIMRLIKGTKVGYRLTQNPHPQKYKYKITTLLPPKPDLTHYDIYAPWVQELEIFDRIGLVIKNLDRFLRLLDGRPPLPNLRRLTTCATAISSTELMSFINMFMSPSLTEIRTVLPRKGLPEDSCSCIPPSSVPGFLEKIKETCPQIEALEFYPELGSEVNGSESYTPSNQCRSILSSFLNLYSFSSTTYILEPATLDILGRLPRLESLGIRGSPTKRPVLGKKLSIPATRFPSLKDLRLYGVHRKDIKVLWNQPPIIAKLVSALVQTDHLRQDDRRGANWIGPFLAALSSRSPHLQDVAFY
ncbi:hypothetical protein FRC11_011577, partial [Ceratobasidium sp. 423]